MTRHDESESPSVVLDRLYKRQAQLSFTPDKKDPNLDAKTGETRASYQQKVQALQDAIEREKRRRGEA